MRALASQIVLDRAHALRRWGPALLRLLRQWVLGKVDRRRVLLRWKAGSANSLPGELAITRVDSIALLAGFHHAECDAAGMPREWYDHFFAHGATLWTAIEGGRALGSLWVIEAGRLGGWYVQLESNARVIYGVVTPEWARGRGVAGHLALAAARDGEGAPVYLDCMAWNHTAQRAFAKAGFEPFAIAGTRFREARAGPDA